MSQRAFVITDVFTDRPFEGNPLAVVLDADGMTDGEMQAVAAEFKLSETAFIHKAASPLHTASVRIFTSRYEVPFAGHPNIGSAYVLARYRRELYTAEAMLFEGGAGIVRVDLLRENGLVVGGRVTAPETLRTWACWEEHACADALSLHPDQIDSSIHSPIVASMGLPFLVARVTSRTALAAARPIIGKLSPLLEKSGTDAVYLYWGTDLASGLHARMFSPLDGTGEDAATGSAAVALGALLARSAPKRDSDTSFTITQGEDMNRKSKLEVTVEKRRGKIVSARVAGRCVETMKGKVLSSADHNHLAPNSDQSTAIGVGQ